MVIGAYLLMSNFALWRIVKREPPLVNQVMLELFEECKAQAGVQTLVAVVPSRQIRSPGLFGFIRPRLLLPLEMLEKASHDEMRYVFLHELAHLKRHDIYLGWLTSLLQVLHWFNPLVWYAFYRMRADRELACDALVLARTEKEQSQEYGRAIVGLLRRFSRSRPLPAMAGILESRSQLKRRITMISQFKKNSYRWSPLAVVLIVALAGVSLMNAEPASKTRQSANDVRADSAFSQDVIVDPNTGLRFKKICGITSSGDLVEYKRGLDLSFDGKFFFTYGEHVIPVIIETKDEDYFRDLIGFPACRPSWSPDRTMMAFYADGIWLLPLDPETGEPTGPARKLVSGNYWYGPKVEWSPDSEKIVYVSKQDSLLHVLSVKDGVGTQIAKKEASRPSWSPDGQWIAYTQYDGGIWLIPANGGESRELVPAVRGVEPQWSPDGEWIFFGGREGLHFVRVSDALTAVATLPEEVGGYVSWLPNGKMLFARDAYEWRDSLRMISSSGGESIKPDAWSAGDPDWTPDGRFVFTWGKYGDRWIYWVVPFDGGDPYPLQLEVPYGYKPGQEIRARTSLSPSKRKLFFDTHKDPNKPEYWVVPISAKSGTSSGPAVKVFDKAPVKRPCWSPDESKLALICRGEIWIAATDGRPPTRLIEASGRNIMHHAWSPDGSAISWITYDQSSSRSILRVRKLSEDKPRDIAETSKEIRHKWSPSGTWIAYEFWPGDLGATWELFVMPGSTGESKRLKEITRDEHHKAFKYAWCPDGERLGLLADRTLWIIDIPSGRHQQIGGLLDPVWGRCFDMKWSPDGKTLGLILEAKPESTGPTDDISGNTRLFTVSVPKGRWTELAGEEGTNYHLSWSPDGRWIAYNSEESVRTRAAAVVWEVEVDDFLRWAAEKTALPQAPAVKPAHKPHFTKILIPTKPGNGVLSPDGEKLAFVSEGSIWVVPVHGKVSPDIAGEPIRLPGTEKAWHWCMSWSADGAWIAYGNPGEICIVPSSGGKIRRISIEVRGGNNVFDCRLSMSRDGRTVAYSSEAKDKMQIFTADVESGDFKQLTEDGGKQPCFSPDGKRIAYVKPKPQKTEIPKSDIWVLPATGGKPIQVSDLPGRATGPVWSPDGKRIAFTRKTGGDDMSKEVCIVPLPESGKPEATPAQIELPLETWRHLAGWTPDNEIGALLSNPEHQAIYTVPASGGNAVQVTPAGWPCHPRWSPDGKRIFFRWDGISSVPSEGGEVSMGPLHANSEIFVALPGGGNAVSPDGKKIVFSGAQTVFSDNKRNYEVDIYTIPIEGGEPKKLTISPGQDRFPCWSPDGKSIAFIRYPEPTKEMTICIVAAEGGEVRQLTSESHRVTWSTIAWSPDGRSIAYFSEDKAVKVIPVQGGQPRVVVKVEDVSSHSEVAWSPDGSKLVYSSKGSIWVISSDGGQPEEIRTGLDAKACHVSWSPDGEKMAFTAMGDGDTELWLMANFLSEDMGK
jgi:Tol biopolymer transport system component